MGNGLSMKSRAEVPSSELARAQFLSPSQLSPPRRRILRLSKRCPWTDLILTGHQRLKGRFRRCVISPPVGAVPDLLLSEAGVGQGECRAG